MLSPENYYQQEKIAEKKNKQIDLLIEQKEISEKIKKYDYLPSSLLFMEDNEFVDPKKLEAIKDEWLKRVRQETALLTPFDEFGVKLFDEEPNDPKKYPEIEIKFKDKSLHEASVKHLSDISGIASAEKKIKIKKSLPSVKTQMRFLLEKGRLHSDLTTFVHEIIHINHFQKNKNVDPSLSELQAFLSEIYFSGQNFDAKKMINNLSESYTFNKNKISYLFGCTETLHATGATEAEISQLIAGTNLDEHTGRLEPFETYVENIAKNEHVTLNDIKTNSRARGLTADINLKKAQLTLYETINRHFSTEDLQKIQKKYAINRFTPPRYYKNNVAATLPFTQTSIAFDNPEFPYDPADKTSGLILGEFSTNAEGEASQKINFSIGRYEAKDAQSEINLLHDQEKIDHYLKILRQNADKISFYQKKQAYNKLYVYRANKKLSPLHTEVINAILSKDDIKNILSADQEDFENEFGIIKKELNLILQAKIRDEQSDQKIHIYSQMLEERENILQLYDLSWSDIGALKNFDKHMETAKKVIAEIKKLPKKF